MIAPMPQGHRVTLRSALKVVLSRHSRVSQGAGGRVQRVDRALLDGQDGVAGHLDWAGQPVVLALVAQISQHGVLGVGPLGQRVEQPVVGASAGGVVLAPGPDR
jgi:hypothetical protein